MATIYDPNYDDSDARFHIEHGYYDLMLGFSNAVLDMTLCKASAFFAAGYDQVIDQYMVFFANHDGSIHVPPTFF